MQYWIRPSLIRGAMVALMGMAALGLTPAAHAAGAGDYPHQTVRITVPFPPGGTADVLARLLGDQLAQKWQQPVVVENRAGAGGIVGTQAVVRRPADGYSLLVVTVGHAVNPHIHKALPYDTQAELTPVAKIATLPSVLLVNPNKLEANSVAELVAQAKAAPGALTFASSGNASTSHVAAALLTASAGIQAEHIPYQGSAPAMTDLLAGHVDWMIDPLASAMPHVSSGKLKALAITTEQRSALAPDIPTMQEAGVPGYDFSSWFLLLAPAGIPDAVAQQLNADVQEVLGLPAVQQRLVDMGAEAGNGSPEELAQFVASEIQRYGELASAAHMRVE